MVIKTSRRFVPRSVYFRSKGTKEPKGDNEPTNRTSFPYPSKNIYQKGSKGMSR